MRLLASAFISASFLLFAGPAQAADIPFNPNVKLKVGKSIILKGVRGDCGKPGPTWAQLAPKLPKSKTGSFSDGGTGMTPSGKCKGKTPARAVRFTAKTKGEERFTIYQDGFSIKVE
ncbi:MAG: hypothetical protein KF723_18070 [Rhizobiaceae bacterium]|nr:hypothetical protein [Rhizobiaceae bacterium]